MGIPAGWYQDLEDAGRMRWWDGEGWTSSTREREALDGPPAGPSERIASSRPSGTLPEAGHVTSSALAAAAAEVAARLGGADPSADSARSAAAGRAAAEPPAEAPAGADGQAERAPSMDGTEPVRRAPRTVRIDDRELGHLLDVVPEVPPHLLPIPPERSTRAARPERRPLAGRTERPGRGERAEAQGSRRAGRFGRRAPEQGDDAPAMPVDEPAPATTRNAHDDAVVPQVRLDPFAGSGRRRRRKDARVPLGRRAALRRTVLTGGVVALVVVGAVGFLLDDGGSERDTVAAPSGADGAPAIDPLLDEIPVVPELGEPGADGGPEGEAETLRRVAVELGGPCGMVELEVPVDRDVTTLRAWDAEDCALAPVALGPGEQRWVVVRASLNGAAADEASARASAERAGADGLLWSSYYASLNPDLWVVFDGPFASRAEAEAAAVRIGGGSYARVLSDDEGDRFCIAPGGCTGAVPRD